MGKTEKEKELLKAATEQAARLNNEDLYNLVINKMFNAGVDHDLDMLHEAEVQKDILGRRLSFSIYQHPFSWERDEG